MGMIDNLLVISEDLGQKYHRGIAYYAKSLLKATHSLGYHNFLLTGAPISHSSDLKELNVIKNLLDPTPVDFGKKKKIAYYLKKTLGKIRFEEISNNRFLDLLKNETRLDYVQHLQGFLNNSSLYPAFDFHPMYFNSPVKIKLPQELNYRAIISTNPLPIEVKHVPLIQTLHDIIPVSTYFHPCTSNGLERIYKKNKKIISSRNITDN